MKIGFDAKRAFNNTTGLGNHARILLNALMRDYPGQEYLLYTPKVEEEFVKQLHGKFEIKQPQSGLQKALHAAWRSFGITGQLKRDRVNVYHGLSNELPFNIHNSGIKTVVTIHDVIFLKHTEQYPFIDRQVYQLKTKYATQHADKIIAVSNETKNDLIDFYKVPEEKITVIYPSVNANFQAENKLSEKRQKEIAGKYSLPGNYILHVGSFFPRKNQSTIIEAFALIKDKVKANLVLVGSNGSMRDEIEKLITRKGLQRRVKIISNVSNTDMPGIYQLASAFVFPSWYEGFGSPILEALFSGTPVIATRGGCMQEAGGPDSIYIDPMNEQEIANAILKVLGDKELSSQMINAGYLHAKEMTDAVFAAKTMEVYQALA